MPKKKKKALRPPQRQKRQPGREGPMEPQPRFEREAYRPAGKLRDRVALITGGDSGIGRSVAVHFAKEGADVAIVYLDEHDDAAETKRQVEQEGQRCVTIAGDLADEAFCRQCVKETLSAFGKLDILVNNAAEQHPRENVLDITPEQFERTFRTNIFAYFYMVRAALPHLKSGASILNTTSVTAYRGTSHLLDYASTKGAIVAFTRSLALMLVEQGIRVNGVAPGPIWTPLIPSTFPAERTATFGSDVPMGREGQPDEVAPSYVFLASADASYFTGQVLHPNGGGFVST